MYRQKTSLILWFYLFVALILLPLSMLAAIDEESKQPSDIWELTYPAESLLPDADEIVDSIELLTSCFTMASKTIVVLPNLDRSYSLWTRPPIGLLI